jgi:predicted dehydrogenase
VYVEKPVSHDLAEGRRMVEAARKYKVVIQAGTQRRSSTAVAAAREFVKSGKLGNVPFARAWIAGSRKPIGKLADTDPPGGVDYDLWLGPAPARPFNPNRFHYNWHWFWDLGTGELGNNGIHGLDVARYVLDLDAPTRVSSMGGKYVFDDDRETPDTQTATFDFPWCTLVWEHRVWEKNGPERLSFGVILHGERGTLLFDDKGWHVRDGDDMKEPPGPDPVKAHQKNFIDAIRGDAKPAAEIEEGHRSTRLCHLGNIAFRTGKVLRFDAKTEATDDPAANKLLARGYRKGFELPAV